MKQLVIIAAALAALVVSAPVRAETLDDLFGRLEASYANICAADAVAARQEVEGRDSGVAKATSFATERKGIEDSDSTPRAKASAVRALGPRLDFVYRTRLDASHTAEAVFEKCQARQAPSSRPKKSGSGRWGRIRNEERTAIVTAAPAAAGN